MAKIFKGFRQVTSTAFEQAKLNNALAGYLWFVRTVVPNGDVNSVADDEYDIYFGSAHYGHFREGEISALSGAIDNLRSDLGFNFGDFSFEGATTVKDAFAKVSELMSGLVSAIEKNAAAIEGEAAVREAEMADLKDSAYAYADGLNKTMDERVKALEAIDHDAYVDADAQVLADAKKYADDAVEAEKVRAEAAEKKNADAIEALATSVDTKVADAIAEVVADAPEDFDTLKEIADYIKNDQTGAAELANRISALEAIDHDAYVDADAQVLADAKKYADDTFVKVEGFNEFTTEMESKLEGVEAGAQVNVVESVKVNGVDAVVADKVAEVKVDAKDIELGQAIVAGETEVYGSTQKLSNVLQGIQDSISAAVSGGLTGVVAGDGIEVSAVAANKQTISAKVSADADNMLKMGTDGGLFVAMYYDGDDME